MKHFRILGLAVLALFALSAFAAGMASAEEGVLPPSNFTVTGGTQTLTNLREETIVCKAVTGTGKFLTEKEKDQHATGTLDFTGCTASGFAANTLGDEKEVILAKVLYLICLTEPKTLLFGVLVLALENPVHIEVPIIKALILVKGYTIGSLETEKEAKGKVVAVLFNEKDKHATCEINGTLFTSTYLASIDSKEDVDAFQSGLVTVTFEKEVTFMDT